MNMDMDMDMDMDMHMRIAAGMRVAAAWGLPRREHEPHLAAHVDHSIVELAVVLGELDLVEVRVGVRVGVRVRVRVRVLIIWRA